MEEEEGVEEACNNGTTNNKEVAPALLVLHPQSKFVVVAVGSQLRIFNLLRKCPVTINNCQSCHGDAIRSAMFSKDGKLFASAGDDKLVKLWDAESWECTKTVHANKKISATSFSHDGEWLLYADKFGVVYGVPTAVHNNVVASTSEPVQLLAHCCSIITSLKCSADGRFILTADRDSKIRVSIYPKNPYKGAHEIEGFCLGHTSFVSCLAFVGEDLEKQLFISGGGDGKVILWEVGMTSILDTLDVSQHTNMISDDNCKEALSQCSTITFISALYNGTLIAVGVESLNGVVFLRCDIKSRKLSFLQKLELGEHYCPTSLQFNRDGQLWLVAGAAQKTDFGSYNTLTWTQVVTTTSHEPVEFTLVEPDRVLGGKMLLETLDGTGSDVDKALALASAANVAVKSELSKRQYTPEHREFRKRTRNDKKLQQKA